MNSRRNHVFPSWVALAFAVAVGWAGTPAVAQEPEFDLILPAGVACSFPLQLVGYDGKLQYREFYDGNGNPVRLLFAGKGSRVVMTNLNNNSSYTMKSAGAASTVRMYPDGTATISTAGHFVTWFTPLDDPPGPSTIMFSGGREIYAINADGNATLQFRSGNMTDICALLMSN